MRSSQISGTISEESPAVGAKKFLVWITVGWVSGAGTVFLVLLVLTLGAAQESDDLAGAGSVIAAAAMTAIFLQFMWPFLLVLFPVTAAGPQPAQGSPRVSLFSLFRTWPKV